MNIVLFGYGEMGCTGLEFLLSQGERVAGVITHRDDPGEKRWFRSLEELARASGVPVFHDDGERKGALRGLVRGLEPHLVLSFYFRRMIPQRVLDLAPKGALNLHGSLLPRLRGRAPLNWALVECEERSGVTLHHMVAEPDAGDIVAQRGFDIGPRDTARTLFDKAVAETKILLREIWPQIRAGTAPRIPQDHSKATYRGRRRPEDGRIDWSQPTRRVDGLVRAVTDPFPGAFTSLQGKKLMVWQGSPAEGRGIPGRVIRPSVVATLDGAYQIEKWEFPAPEDGRPPLDPGAQLGE
ncbi:MAG TPA: formyltransferase family protein [Planctomycetota bacterium]|nr:formyltransferase family protein [Planctomycetota bacterium]